MSQCTNCGVDVELDDVEDGTCGVCGFDGGEGPVISLPTLVPLKPEVAAELVSLIRGEHDLAEMDLSTVIPAGADKEYYRGLATGLISGAQVAERYLEPTPDASQSQRGAWLMSQADYGLLQFAAILRYLEPDADELKPKVEAPEPLPSRPELRRIKESDGG